MSRALWSGVLGLVALGLVGPARGTSPAVATPDWSAAAYPTGPRSFVSVDADGAHFPSAPHVPDPSAVPDLRVVQRHLRAGDRHLALKAAESLVSAKKWGRDRTAAWFVIGMLHREEGRHNLASEAFTKVRLTRGPLAPFGAYYEAEQDLFRGKPGVAVQECKAYMKKWSSGHHVQACRRIIARGHAARGHAIAAKKAAEEHDKDNADTPVEELVLLTLARYEHRTDPEKATWRLKELWREHQAPLTGRVATELLEDLKQRGIEGAEIPQDTESLKARAVSLRAAGNADEAWAAFEELSRRATDNPRLQTWLHDQAPLFAWWTRHYEYLADYWGAEYEADSTAEHAWNWYRGLGRSARWTKAGDVGLASLKKHGGTREWRRKHEEVGRTLMLAKRYPEARATFDTVKGWGGWRGRRGQFFAAFASYMAGEHEDAIARFDAIIEKDRSNVLESHYWRAKSLDALGRAEEAETDRQYVREAEPMGWYALNLAQGGTMPTMRPFARDGSWPGVGRPVLPDAPVAHAAPQPAPVSLWAAPRMRTSTAFALLSWPMPTVTALPASIRETVVRADPFAPPPSYRDGVLFTESEARREFRKFAAQNDDTWPVLGAVYDLASAGLYDLSGPLFSEFYEEWRESWRYKNRANHERAREISLRDEDWRQLFYYARDHHHSTRFTVGIANKIEDPITAREVRRYAYPLAHARYVWEHGEEHGLDPYLVMGLMRQESIYDANALSRAGARGAMQIMPRTGYLLADLAHDADFTAGDLEDPILSIERGITYLGLLMRRFEGAYPLAVAAYNGGPHNVSRWTRGTGADMPIDEYVEHIPFQETRGYVKGVSSRYATYLSLYTDGTAVVLPETPRGDHPDVVDF